MNWTSYSDKIRKLTRKLSNSKLDLKSRAVINEQIVYLNMVYIKDATKTHSIDRTDVSELRDITCGIIDNIINIYTRLDRPLQVYMFTRLRKEIASPIRIIK